MHLSLFKFSSCSLDAVSAPGTYNLTRNLGATFGGALIDLEGETDDEGEGRKRLKDNH